MLGSHRILIGDVLEQLSTLPDASVHCVVTSPPYWGLRDYGTATWEGGDAECDHVTRHGLQGATGQRADRTFTGSQNYYSDTCGKCGARRIDSQIGLEATPDLFVAKMVEVFQAVRRVLRDDGTLWLNLGDSYCNAGSQRNGEGLDGSRRGGATGPDGALGYKQNDKRRTLRASGIKHKDLCGIPWSVAKALQEPYYTGTIRRVEDRIWLACAIDAEGCMFIHKRKAGQHNGQGYHRKNDNYGPGLEVANTSEAFVRRCMEITGRGSICHQDKGRKQRIYRWNLRTIECRDVIREIYPHLVAKQHEARILCGCPSSGEKAAKAHAGLIALHNGHEPGIDFDPPASMYEPGWYLRSDIIWSKCNPMPESVTDRPTKAHEYLFLLTKRPRYYYDADAVREAAEYGYSETVGDGFISAGDNGRGRRTVTPGSGGSRNLRSVWSIPTQAYPEAHFATFPEKLVEPCVKAGTSEKGCCPECGKPWVRVVEKESHSDWRTRQDDRTKRDASDLRNDTDGVVPSIPPPTIRTLGWRPGCECCPPDIERKRWEKMRWEEKRHYWTEREWTELPPTVPCTVLDPFCGSGTTLLVACRLGRDAIGIELNPEYAAQAEDRIGKGLRPATHRSDRVEDAPLFTGGNGNG